MKELDNFRKFLNEGPSKEGLSSQIQDIKDALENGEINGEPLTNETEQDLQKELKNLEGQLSSIADQTEMDVEMRDKKDRRAGINPLMELEQERDPVKILRGLMRRGEEMVDFANKQSEYEGGVSTPVRGVLAAATVAGAPEFDINGKTDYDLLDYWKRKLEKAFITMKGRKYMDGFFDNSKARFNELNEVATPFDLLDSAHSDTSMDLRKYISQNEPDLLQAFLDAEGAMRFVLDDVAYAGADDATKRRRNHQAQSSDIDGYVDDPSNPLGEPDDVREIRDEEKAKQILASRNKLDQTLEDIADDLTDEQLELISTMIVDLSAEIKKKLKK